MPAATALLGACAGKTASEPADAGFVHPEASAIDRMTLDEPYHPDASCLVTIDTPPLLPATHVAIGTDVSYDSNPPSSGPHYPIWAAFQEFQAPVDRRYYVHDLEHGAIVLLYNCALASGGDAGCEALVQGLRDAVTSLATDPLCDPSIRVRTVITPDPLIASPVAAAAWGWTYNAACLDAPTLRQFAKDHYGQGPEQVCAQGTTTF